MNIKENCKILKLSYIFKNYEEEIKEAKQTKKDVGVFLDELLEKEITQRKDNGIKKRLRYAKFPIKKYLEDFDRKLYNPEFAKEFEELETLEFIEMVLTGECTTERLMDILFCESDSSYDIGISEFKNKLN